QQRGHAGCVIPNTRTLLFLSAVDLVCPRSHTDCREGMVSALSSSGMTSARIALQILRGSSGGTVEPVSAIGSLQKPTVVSKADTAIATIMRIIVDSQGTTTISGSNDRSAIVFADGWDVDVKATRATGQGSV